MRTNPKALTLFLGIAVACLVIAWWLAKSLRNSSPQPQEIAPTTGPSALSSTVSPATNHPEDFEPQEMSPSQLSNFTRLPSIIKSTSRPVAGAAPSAPRSEPTSHARQLVAGLAQLDPSRGPITKEQADQWKQTLQALIQQGAPAVSAIREILEQNFDLNYGGSDGGQWLGQSSLRTALLDALRQIGGPEALDVMLQTLRVTALPGEVALLAKYLEQSAPGQYRQETLTAVQETLAMASRGELPGWDVGPLFQVLQNVGDAATVATLEQLRSQWKYYATISLAGLQEGQGVQSLVRQAQSPAAGAGTRRDLALQMLAQVAAQYPDAAAALTELARANRIPDSAWRGIAAGLAGDQYHIGIHPDPGLTLGTVAGLRNYHVASGNQNFYSIPLNAGLPAHEIQRRLALLDQLRAAGLSPTANQALESVQAALGERLER